jgi:hypothetical protein
MTGADALPAAFARAAELRPHELREHWLRFAGRPVRLRAVGADLARDALRPLAHLAAAPPGEEPALSIDLWDERATGVPCPVAPEPAGRELASDGVVWRHSEARGITDYSRSARRMVGWRADGHANPTFGVAKPLPVLLPVWYLDQGMNFVHGGMVARDGAGALISGPSGRGKSTTALACAAAGLDFLGDDQSALEETASGEFVAHSVWSVAEVSPERLRSHPELACESTEIEADGPKVAIYLGAGSRARTRDRAGVRVIVLFRRSGGESSSLAPATPAQALLTVAPSSTLAFGRVGARWGLDRLERLVRAVPAVWLDAGTDLTGVVEAVDRALAEAA